MSRRKSVRLDRSSYVGERRCFFTIRTHRHQPAFRSAAVVDAVRLQFLQCAEREQIEITGYCFMPDHLHLLTLGLTPASDARVFVNLSKQRSGFWYSRQEGRPLWQRYAWDHVLRSHESRLSFLKYILMNPVRAGLASDPLDYPFSGSTVHSREALRQLITEPDRLPTLP